MIFYYDPNLYVDLHVVEKTNDKSFGGWQIIKIIKSILGKHKDGEKIEISKPSFKLYRGMYEVVEAIFDRGG